MTRFLVISGFVLAVVVGLVIGYLASRVGSRIPRLGDIAGAVMRYDVGGLPVGRLALLGFWFWCGWHFLAR
jgi:Family of unknown function (DUF6186)